MSHTCQLKIALHPLVYFIVIIVIINVEKWESSLIYDHIGGVGEILLTDCQLYCITWPSETVVQWYIGVSIFLPMLTCIFEF